MSPAKKKSTPKPKKSASASDISKDAKNCIVVQGAREHNLKSIDISIPRNQLVVITGLSGSGKSSLAFDTIYAEGQRRYVESLSTYARQFLELTKKPDCDSIEGLSPAISIDQKSTSRNPRSTVGTVTEVYDYLRLLFAKIGEQHCHQCGKKVTSQNPTEITDIVTEQYAGQKISILAPVVKDKKGEHLAVFDQIKKEGYVRLRCDGQIVTIDEELELNPKQKHSIEVVIDRLEVKTAAASKKLKSGETIHQEDPDRARLAESVELALKVGNGEMILLPATGDERYFSELRTCCGHSYPELSPKSFSFNSPHGACPACQGIGETLEADPKLILPNPRLSLAEGAIKPWSASSSSGWYMLILRKLATKYNFSLDVPVSQLPDKIINILFYGEPGAQKQNDDERLFTGISHHLKKKYEEADSESARNRLIQYMRTFPCSACDGQRLRPESLAVKVADRSIHDITTLSISSCLDFFENLKLSERQSDIANMILKEIRSRLNFLINVGLAYLTLSRGATTLSGGEAQRIRLATQIGSSLIGVLYVLDEPSIGLHQRDNSKLIKTLQNLRDIGNSVIIVEHDEETMMESDYLIDIGPGAGRYGGEVVSLGIPNKVMKDPQSITGQYLSGKKSIPIPDTRRKGNGKKLKMIGAKQNNLKNINVTLPLGQLVGVTGVSGSGKSSLINQILVRALSRHFYRSHAIPGEHKEIKGIEYLDKIIDINQSPIGRTPRSNPATYTGLFTDVRALYASLPEAKLRGYKEGRFSFNVKGGRCEVCQGDGTKKIEMHFLPDVYVECEACQGQRYNRETLEIRWRGATIADVLNMTVNQAAEFFSSIPALLRKLETLQAVGLGYIKLGQSAVTLSGGEAQRVKLATELSRRSTGKTLYVLDEPTTGLHFQDVEMLLSVLQRLVDSGNTVLVIEHNLDVIKSCDYLIDMGPEGGAEGGTVIATGTPEEVAKVKDSYTGHYLAKLLKKK